MAAANHFLVEVEHGLEQLRDRLVLAAKWITGRFSRNAGQAGAPVAAGTPVFAKLVQQLIIVDESVASRRVSGIRGQYGPVRSKVPNA